jgi:Kef-type K+ transport system membrane component KefB
MTIAGHALTETIEFQMSLLLFMALGGYLLANRLNQPAVVGVILAGVLIGPTGFDLIHYSDFVASLGHIGAIVLLFVIGLEFHLKEITKPSYFLIALGGVVLPWAGGYAVAAAFGFEFSKAIIISVALTATSIAITADTLREMGKLKSEAAQAIIGAAIIDDVLALMVLAIAQQLSSGAVDMALVSVFVVKAAIFLIGGALLGDKVLTPLVHHIDHSKIADKYPDFVFILIMMMAFFYAMVAELMSLSAIVGAFIAGVSFERVHTERSKDFRVGSEYLRIIFGAIFFISLGILADFSTFTWGAMEFALALTVVAVLSKIIGCGLLAKLSGMSNHTSLVVGVGMSPRGEVAMTIALLAFLDGVIEQPAFVALIVMSLLTTIIAPLLLRNWLYRNESG